MSELHPLPHSVQRSACGCARCKEAESCAELARVQAIVRRVVAGGEAVVVCAADPAIADWLDAQGHRVRITRPYQWVYRIAAPVEA